jgi:membrane-associated protease RseP (regulator of RpoE activity)
MFMADLNPSLSSRPQIKNPVKVLVYHARKPRYWLHGLLLGLTLFTTLVVGARMQYNFQHNLPCFYTGDDSLDIFPWQWALHPVNLALGVPFSLSLLLILMAHEMGHYLYCRRYGVWATLPFFIPFPSLFGTMGAFIRIRSPIESRDALFDIGIAGPIAGFVVATVVLWISLSFSTAPPGLATLPAIKLQYPLIFQLLNHGHGAGGGVPLTRLNLHPMAIAAWVGMFATALNLLPGGQLDGGHIVFSLAPRAHRLVSGAVILALLPLGYYYWAGWLIWPILIGVTGLRHPIVPGWPGVNRSRYLLAIFALIMLALTFTPAPVAELSLPQFVRQVRGH